MRGWFLIFRKVEVGRLAENSTLVKKASEQMIITLQSLHHGSVGYQHVHTWIGLTKKAKFLRMQPRTQARTRKKATKLADECIAHECGVLQTVEWQNCSWQINLSKTPLMSVVATKYIS
jgi:hypothetical protein